MHLAGRSKPCFRYACLPTGRLKRLAKDITLRFKIVDMGRPRVDDQDKRVVQVNIRLTEDEYKKANEHAEASQLSLANWIRRKVFTGKFPPRKLSPLDSKIYYELRKMGVNLNQIAHKINQGEVPKEYLLFTLQVRTKLTAVLKLLSNDGKPG